MSKLQQKAKPRAAKKVARVSASETTPKTAAEVKPKGKVAAKPAKAKREPKPKEDLCVFALRMTPDERDRLHAATGPARATRYARAVLIAFSNGDDVTFRRLVKEAEEGKGKAKK